MKQICTNNGSWTEFPKPSSPSHTAPSEQQPNNGAQRLRLAPQKGHNLMTSGMAPFDSLLFCKLGIPFLGVCYSCNKSRARLGGGVYLSDFSYIYI